MVLKRLLAVVLAAMLACMALSACAAQDKQEKTGLSGIKIIVDPGHGDIDIGTTGVLTGRYEKEVNLEIGLKLQAALEKEGATVVMTRESDEPIAAEEETDVLKRKEADMQRREEIITTSQADMYIGVHQNSFEDKTIAGPQVFYYTDSAAGKELASCIQAVMNEQLQPAAPRTINCGRYRLLKPGNQPSVTVECGFFTNAEEEKKLQTEEYQKKVVTAIVDGIKRYAAENLNAE
ncbi:MAG: N-acetylmuramoyl-L-alanine amidase [Christensenella sp.]|nr:N-acetylmuramoyl-L-alanine amidase [Christensenella sp.]